VIAVRRLGRDSSIIAWRNLLNLRRTPGSVIAALVQPVMFVLLLAYVFGGSLGGADYRTFLMGGIFAQAVTFNAAFTALGLANDMDEGIVDRFRSLPMPPMAVLLGRTLSDLTMSAVTLAVTSLCGLLVGWRIAASPGDALLAYLLILLFAFAMSWVGAAIGLLAPLLGVRLHPHDARTAAYGRGVEPGLRHGDRRPPALRQSAARRHPGG